MDIKTQKSIAALEIAIGYASLVAEGVGSMPILKSRAKDDCRIFSEAIRGLSELNKTEVRG